MHMFLYVQTENSEFTVRVFKIKMRTRSKSPILQDLGAQVTITMNTGMCVHIRPVLTV